MKNRKYPFDVIKDKLTALKNLPPGKNNGKSSYLLILLLLGVVFMILGNFWKGNNEDQPAFVHKTQENVESAETLGKEDQSENNDMKKYEKQYESQLKEALEDIVGVHSVTAVVNVQATEKKVYEKNSILKNQTTGEEDKEGGVREIEDQSKEDQLVIIRDNEKEVPVLLETRKPEIKGVLIVAGGAENIQVKKWIIEAVTRALDVPSHKVAVIPKKSKGDS